MHEMHSEHATRFDRWPSREVIDFQMTTARDMRAEATAQFIAGIGRGIARLVRPLASRLGRWKEESATRDALMRRSDRLLADIGIAREDIPLVARGIDPHTYQGPAVRRWWRGLRSAADRQLEARRERRRVQRELMEYSDRDLQEIGVRRRDIPEIAKGQYAEAA